MQTLEFPSQRDRTLYAQIEGTVLIITCGWSVPIPRDVAIEYAKRGYTHGNADGQGFYNKDSKVGLHHGDLRIDLEVSEAHEIIALIKTAFADGFKAPQPKAPLAPQPQAVRPSQHAGAQDHASAQAPRVGLLRRLLGFR